jgi:hypothetical protein
MWPNEFYSYEQIVLAVDTFMILTILRIQTYHLKNAVQSVMNKLLLMHQHQSDKFAPRLHRDYLYIEGIIPRW